MKLPNFLFCVILGLVLAAGSMGSQALAADALAGDVQAARAKNSMCIGCHGISGYKATFPEVYHVPKIAGQNAEYLALALDEYRKGTRNHPSMAAIAHSLTDQDIADLATYYSSLK
jgi:cytochrome c553